jgi:cytoskeletal protein RodZ
MSPIGETLRAAREEKGLNLDRVAEETNIAKRYLAALEAEDFTVFPGDSYAIGFLRNYAEYLGLAADDLVATFKNMRIQEQPVPIQELIPKRGLSPLAIGGIIGGGIVLVVLVIVVAAGQAARNRGMEMGGQKKAPVEYRIEGASFQHRLYEGDSVLVKVKSGEVTDSYKILLAKIDDAVTFETPVGKDRLMLGEEGTLDLDKNGSPEIKLVVSEFAKKDAAKGAIIHVDYVDPSAALAAAAEAPAADQAAPGDDAADAGASPAQGSAAPQTQPSLGTKSAVLFESANTPYPFVVTITFRGPCMFRFEADRKNRDEHYYRKGETVTINANNAVKIWTSNAQAAKLTVQASGGKTADVELGGAGEVSVKRIAWTQAGGGYALSVLDVD